MSSGDRLRNASSFEEQLRGTEDLSSRWRTDGPQLIKEAGEENNSFKLMMIINKGITTDETWPSYRDGGVVDLLVKLVCERPDHGPDVPEHIVPPWNFPMQGLASISERTLLSKDEHPAHFEEWDGPTNSKMKNSIGRILQRVLRDERLKYLDPRHDVASFLLPFLMVGDAQWIQSIPEIWQFIWKSWALDSLDERKEQRYLFSDELRFTLEKLYPDGRTVNEPQKPFISNEEALKRALSLLRPVPLEKASDSMKHIQCMLTLCRLYPEYSRVFLEGGVLAHSVKAIGVSAFAPGNLDPGSPREFHNSNDWNAQILDQWNEIMQFWIELLRGGDVQGDQKNMKAISAVSKALNVELIDRVAFVVTRAMNEDHLKSVKTLLSLLFNDYAAADIVLARQMALKQVYIFPRMDGFSKDDSAPAMVKPVGSAWMHYIGVFESLMSKALKNCAWVGCMSSEKSPGVTPQLRCSKCKSVVYCGAECQKLDWPSHKKSCKKLPV